MLVGLGLQATHNLLDQYFETYAPEPYAAVEADRFLNFLRPLLPRFPHIPFFDEVLSYEQALLSVVVYRAPSQIRWSGDPVLIFESLDAGKLPSNLPAVGSSMCICTE